MTNTVTVDCGKCSGSGRYYFHGGSGVCYPCDGSGKIKMARAKYEAALAYRAKADAAQAVEAEREDREDRAFQAATAAIDTSGIDGARRFYADHRDDSVALGGLVNAMRNARMFEASNAVAARVRELQAAGK